jgi:hypothetical protein
MIKVRATMDRMGNIVAAPVSDRWSRRFAARCQKNGGPADRDCFFQEGMAASEFLESLRPAQRRDLNNGWTVTFMADPWEVGHWYGYDAHTVCE